MFSIVIRFAIGFWLTVVLLILSQFFPFISYDLVIHFFVEFTIIGIILTYVAKPPLS